jgi:alpha-beta hydrolase superfamily lysophospholipase
MGLVMERDKAVEGYETVPLAVGDAGAENGRALLRRRSAWRGRVRPSRRGVMYVLCLGDEFVSDDVVSWYTDRGFHFYAADLREVGKSGRSPRDGKAAAEDLGECFDSLDAAAARLRGDDDIDTLVVCAHGAGALVVALWCHARRGSGAAEALILARPHLGRPHLGRPHLGGAHLGGRSPWRGSPMIAGAQRRLRHGLDIACPVLVMSPAADWETPGAAGGAGSHLVARVLARGRATIRLGEHVTWLNMAAGLPGDPHPSAAERRRFFVELSRWLSAYLSAEVRDQLL